MIRSKGQNMARDLYAEILGVPAGARPPHFYDLLGLPLFENDGSEIHAGGLRQMRQLKDWQLHKDPEVARGVQELLNEVSRACTTLEIPARKSVYDDELAKALGVALPGSPTLVAAEAPPAKRWHLKQDVAAPSGQPAAAPRAMIRVPEFQFCSRCGAQMSLLALICIECGYDTRTGRTAEVAPSSQHSHGKKARAELALALTYVAGRMLVWGLRLAVLLFVGFLAVEGILWLRDPECKLPSDHRDLWEAALASSPLCQIYLAHRRECQERRPYLSIGTSLELGSLGNYCNVYGYEQPGGHMLISPRHGLNVTAAEIQSDINRLGEVACQRRLAQDARFVAVLSQRLSPSSSGRRQFCALIRESGATSPEVIGAVRAILQGGADPEARVAALECLIAILSKSDRPGLMELLTATSQDADPELSRRASAELGKRTPVKAEPRNSVRQTARGPAATPPAASAPMAKKALPPPVASGELPDRGSAQVARGVDQPAPPASPSASEPADESLPLFPPSAAPAPPPVSTPSPAMPPARPLPSAQPSLASTCQAFIITKKIQSLTTTKPAVLMANGVPLSIGLYGGGLLDHIDGKCVETGEYHLFEFANKGRMRLSWTGKGDGAKDMMLYVWDGLQFRPAYTFPIPSLKTIRVIATRPASEEHVYLLANCLGGHLSTDCISWEPAP